jgi:hypothetical protein
MPIDKYMNEGGARDPSELDLLPTGDDCDELHADAYDTARRQARQRKRARVSKVQQEASTFLAQLDANAPPAVGASESDHDTDSYSDSSVRD